MHIINIGSVHPVCFASSVLFLSCICCQPLVLVECRTDVLVNIAVFSFPAVCPGTLPSSWSGLSVLATTALNLSNNRLEGGIPDSWQARTVSPDVTSGLGSGWSLLDFSGNQYLCGAPVPGWFFSRMVALSTTQLLAGGLCC